MAKRSPEMSEQRIDDRHLVNASGTIQARGTPVQATIIDLSKGGFSAELTEDLPIGSVIELAFSTIARTKATVVWRSGQEYGFEFVNALETVPNSQVRNSGAIIWVDFNKRTTISPDQRVDSPARLPIAARIAVIFALAVVSWLFVIYLMGALATSLL